MLLPCGLSARWLIGATRGTAAKATAQYVSHEDHPEAQQSQEQLGAQVGIEGHQDEDGEDARDRQVRQVRVESHLHPEPLRVLALQAGSHPELRDGDHEVNEERHGPRGVQQE